MKTKKQKIIELWEKTMVVHPSYGSIAKRVGVNVSYVFQVIKKHKNEKQSKVVSS